MSSKKPAKTAVTAAGAKSADAVRDARPKESGGLMKSLFRAIVGAPSENKSVPAKSVPAKFAPLKSEPRPTAAKVAPKPAAKISRPAPAKIRVP